MPGDLLGKFPTARLRSTIRSLVIIGHGAATPENRNMSGDERREPEK